MVEKETFLKKLDLNEMDLVALISFIEKYPYFELAREKFLVACENLGIMGPLAERLKAKKCEFQQLLEERKSSFVFVQLDCNNEEAVEKFINNYILPKSPIHFINK